MFVILLNWSDNNVKSITIKYLTVGHTFMSADSFHKNVELAMKKMDKVYDFVDFIECVDAHGKSVVMNVSDFYLWESGLSQGKASKGSRPLLKDVSVVQFRRGSTQMYFKRRHDQEFFEETDFLQKKVKKVISQMPKVQTEKRGISSKKKNAILKDLGPLIASKRRSTFFENLSVNEESVDLTDCREE